MDLALEQNLQEVFRLAAEAKAVQREKEVKRFYDDLDREKGLKHTREEKDEKEAKELEDGSRDGAAGSFRRRSVPAPPIPVGALLIVTPTIEPAAINNPILIRRIVAARAFCRYRRGLMSAGAIPHHIGWKLSAGW